MLMKAKGRKSRGRWGESSDYTHRSPRCPGARPRCGSAARSRGRAATCPRGSRRGCSGGRGRATPPKSAPGACAAATRWRPNSAARRARPRAGWGPGRAAGRRPRAEHPAALQGESGAVSTPPPLPLRKCPAPSGACGTISSSPPLF